MRAFEVDHGGHPHLYARQPVQSHAENRKYATLQCPIKTSHSRRENLLTHFHFTVLIKRGLLLLQQHLPVGICVDHFWYTCHRFTWTAGLAIAIKIADEQDGQKEGDLNALPPYLSLHSRRHKLFLVFSRGASRKKTITIVFLGERARV